MSSLMGRISEIPNVAIRGLGRADEVVIEKEGGLRFVVTIPHTALEWFVSAHSEEKEVWSDWCDYYSIDRETEETLRAEMADEILRFVRALASSQVRLVADESKKSGKAVEWRIDDSWQRVGAPAA